MIYIGYNKRSFSTAKALRDHFVERGEKCRIINDKKFKHKPHAFIRWGNSYKEAPEGTKEINTADAVKNAADKLLMAHTLNSAEGVSFPPVFFAEEFANLEAGKEYYFRNASGKVVRRAHAISGDLYATENVDRAREFRVHVFGDRTLGVYEKLPHDPNQPYCKNDNCDFKRIDMADDANRSALIGVRPMAKLAVASLGLVFGGVDVIISKDSRIFVNEVNSAPSLNSLNVDRFYQEIMNYISQEEKENEQEIEEEQSE